MKGIISFCWTIKKKLNKEKLNVTYLDDISAIFTANLLNRHFVFRLQEFKHSINTVSYLLVIPHVVQQEAVYIRWEPPSWGHPDPSLPSPSWVNPCHLCPAWWPHGSYPTVRTATQRDRISSRYTNWIFFLLQFIRFCLLLLHITLAQHNQISKSGNDQNKAILFNSTATQDYQYLISNISYLSLIFFHTETQSKHLD